MCGVRASCLGQQRQQERFCWDKRQGEIDGEETLEAIHTVQRPTVGLLE